jgi:hypothetical protein
MRSKFCAVLGTLALGTAALVALAPVAVGATTLGPVDSSITDGQPGSLRDVLENQAADGDTVVLETGATYELTCDGGGHLSTGAEMTVLGNGATIRQTCDEYVWEVLEDTTIDGVTITGGFDDDDRPGGGIHFDGSELVITNSSIVGNQTCGAGGGILMDGGELLHLENSTVAGNSAGEGGGAIASFGSDESVIEIVNSTITANSGAFGGAIEMFEGGAVSLTYVTLAGNTTDATGIPCDEDLESVGDVRGTSGTPVRAQANGTAANVQFESEASTLTTFASVIALPVGGPNCNVDVDVVPEDALSNTVSNGYNFSDDASCDLTGTGDRQTAGDPMLGALGGNGGPTETRLPAEASPLIDGVPLASCQADGAEGITTDQRGVIRPQRTGCDVGAVEVEAITPTPTPEPSPAVIVTPRFTG